MSSGGKATTSARKRGAKKTAATQQQQQQRRVPRKRLIVNASALIRVLPGDNNISMALTTCASNHFEHVYVLDPDYSSTQPMYCDPKMKELFAKVRAAGCTVHFETDEMRMRAKWREINFLVTIPCDNWTSDGKMKQLLDTANENWDTTSRFALAPTYCLNARPANMFIFLLHMFMTFVSFFTWFGNYRGTFVTCQVIERKVNAVMLPDERWFNRDKAQYIWGGQGCRTVCPDNRQGMELFFYLAQRERFSLRIWVCAFIYLFIAAVPFWYLLPTSYGLEGWVLLANNRLLSIWILHAILSLLVINKYFDSPYKMAHAAILPLGLIPWFFLTFYARFLYRGYSEAPKFVVPSFGSSVPRQGRFDALPEEHRGPKGATLGGGNAAHDHSKSDGGISKSGPENEGDDDDDDDDVSVVPSAPAEGDLSSKESSSSSAAMCKKAGTSGIVAGSEAIGEK